MPKKSKLNEGEKFVQVRLKARHHSALERIAERNNRSNGKQVAHMIEPKLEAEAKKA